MLDLFFHRLIYAHVLNMTFIKAVKVTDQTEPYTVIYR
jgi:hypothetical protein